LNPTSLTLGLDRAGILSALRLGFAAWLAFAIAAALHVTNAYWAAMPIWVVAQPMRGLLLERAVFRVLGTLIGAGFGLLVLHVVGAPLLVLSILGFWIALCAGLTHILRGTQSYGALLAGMTAAIVILPTILAPDRAFDVAIARVECTLIGVVVVTLVVGLFTPVSARSEFYARVRSLAGDAVAFAAAAVGDTSGDGNEAEARHILAEMSDVDATGHLVSAGSFEGFRRLRYGDALIGASIAVMASAQSLGLRRTRGESVPATLPEDLTQLAESLRKGDTASFDGLPVVTATAFHPSARLADAVDALVAAERALFADPGSADARSFAPKAVYLAPRRDRRRAFMVGLFAGTASFIASAAALLLGLADAELVALGICIFSMVLGSLPNPSAIAPKLMMGVGCGAAAAILYRIAIQPYATSWLALVVTIAPFMMAGAFARTSRLTAIPALDAIMCFLLASQAGAPATTLPNILMGAGALAVAAILVGTAFAMIPSDHGRAIRIARERIRLDLTRMLSEKADMAAGTSRLTRQLLRLVLDLRRAGKIEDAPTGLLAALNLGHAIFGLRNLATVLSGTDGQITTEAVASLRDFAIRPRAVLAMLEQTASKATDETLRALFRDAAAALRMAATFLHSDDEGLQT
jgi:uncharacterized membrane protein YccC